MSNFWIETMISIRSLNEESILYLDLLNLKTYSTSYYYYVIYGQSNGNFPLTVTKAGVDPSGKLKHSNIIRKVKAKHILKDCILEVAY